VAFGAALVPEYIDDIGIITDSYANTGTAHNSELVSVRIIEPDGRIAYNGISRTELRPVYFSNGKLNIEFSKVDEDGTTYLYILNSGNYLRLYSILLTTLAILSLLHILSMLTSRKRLARSVLQPINEMAEAARNLSASNLDMRINILGTKNELRDLASVINDMLDRIESAYESQKAFVSDASHELRTPISVIRGYAQLLERWGMKDPEVAAEAIAAISSETESMRELVEKLLFLARHDKKTFKLEMETFDLTELCRELVRDTTLIAQDYSIQEGPMQNTAVHADRSAVKQAVRIFIDNAIKYTPKGGTITISCEDMGDHARVSVTDTGPGMTKEEARRAFDRFYRCDSARTSQVGGHGLGLSIARLIASSHGGKISVKTAPGEGSTFRLLLNK
jgi:signal transduction histidine kinase